MKVIDESCIGCGNCVPYCPMGVIFMGEDDIVHISQQECVDCGVCFRAGVCPTDALFQPKEPWPRSVRAAFSNPLTEHKETRIPGRGTEEMKTNEVTGRYRRGYAGVALEMGRPGVGTTFRDVQKVTRALAQLGVEFERKNPLTALMTNLSTGTLNPEVQNEKVLSAIVEFTVPVRMLPAILETVGAVSRQIETVFSLDLICRVGEDGSMEGAEVAKQLGIPLSINGKTNVGLGRPLAKEA